MVFRIKILGWLMGQKVSIVVSLVSLVIIAAVPDVARSRVINGDESDARFGDVMAVVADYDGDGVGDLALGQPLAWVEGKNRVGKVRVFSSATGTEIFSVTGENNGDEFGSSVASAGDLDGDGVAELLVGALNVDIFFEQSDPYAPGGVVIVEVSNVGRIYVVSGADGSFMATADGTSAYESHGKAVVSLGDVNGDGVSDFAVGSRQGTDAAGLLVGSVTVYSGASASSGALAILYRLAGDDAYSNFGAKLSNVGDLDGDGVSDLAVSAVLEDIPGAGDALKDAGSVFLISGADGSTIHRIDGVARTGNLGSSVELLPDLDGDGRADIAIGVPGVDMTGAPNGGQVRIYSSATFGLLAKIDLPWVESGFRLGRCLATVADLDGDGIDDFVAGAPNAFNGLGAALFFSSATLQQLGRALGPSGGVRMGESCLRLPAGLNETIALGAPRSKPGGLVDAGTIFLCSGDDSDGDGAIDCLDNCPDVANPLQSDFDQDGIGDDCDTCNDRDGDGYGEFPTPLEVCEPDLCPGLYSLDQTDSDGDGIADLCDNCVDLFNPDQRPTEACNALKTGSFRVRWRKQTQTNRFQVRAFGEVFTEELLVAAETNPLTISIFDGAEGNYALLFSLDLASGTVARTSTSKARAVKSRLPLQLRGLDFKVNRSGRLTLRVKGEGALTPAGNPVLSVRFGKYHLVAGPRKKR